MRALLWTWTVLFLPAGCAVPGDDPADVPQRDDAGGTDADVGDADDGEVTPDGCTPACTVGNRMCLPPPGDDTLFRVCIPGGDGCAVWGPDTACPDGQFCQEGLCVAECTDVCADGARRCTPGDDATFQTCAVGTRGCLAWGEASACPTGESCTGAGECVPCVDECPDGEVRCQTRDTWIRCERGESGCLAWTDPASCAPDPMCWEGVCTTRCDNVCRSGEMRCLGDDYQICLMQPQGCLGWSAPYACPSGRPCVGAGICPSCTDACTEGEGSCPSETRFRRCEFNGTTGCWVWGPEASCGTRERCEGSGACVPICTDGCPSAGTRECGPGGGPRECVVGALGCLEWTAEAPCVAVANGTNVCLDGACDLTCEAGFLECGPTACRVSCTPWVQQSPVPAYEQLNALDAVGSTVWAAGNAGVVARSEDGGNTWTNAGTAPGGTALNGIDFVTATTGWVVGNGGAVFRSDDGGRNWATQTGGTTAILRSVSFANATHGWAVGDAGVILATTDGGTTWTPQTSGITTALFDVHFVNATTGWAVGASGRILKTANGGAVWLPQTSGSTYDIRSVRFVDTDVGWAVGYQYAFRTTNGGTTWAAFARTAMQYDGVWPLSATSAVIVGASGRVESTSDGGVGWTTRTSGTSNALYDIVFRDALNAVTVGANGTVLSSANGGSTWIDRRGGTINAMRDVHFIDANRGWAVGASGTILATTDAGAAWAIRSSGTTSNLWGVWFADADHGWAVGDSGVIRTTADGGASWTPQTSGSTAAIYDVHFASAVDGWAVGVSSGGSTVRYTPDGGTTWMAEPTGVTTTQVNGVWFNPGGRGWIVGASGYVRYTVNYGVEWRTPTSTGTTQSLNAVRFVSDTNGFAVGGGGVVIVTTDGGLTWIVRGTPVTAVLYGLAFPDPLHGFACGAAGAFIKTVDGGTSWASFPAPTSRELRGLSFLNADDGWVAGDYGTVLRTRSGGE